MTVLADDLPVRNDVPRPAGAPTGAAILEGLKALAAKAQAGDFVVFQFSGHGSTQPVTDPAAQIEPEPDGRDQVLLPRDAGFYDRKLGSIRNAIIDDELALALALDAIRLKGATVWAIIDACHSGTVTRSAGASVTRAVRASTLGVPAGPGATRATPALPRRAGTFVVRASPDKAPLIGFYAVDARAEAVERPFAAFAPGLAGERGQERIGVFTAHLVRAMTSGKAGTFRDLARVVARDMAKLQGSASAPLPVFDGDLDRPIGGGESVAAVRLKRMSGKMVSRSQPEAFRVLEREPASRCLTGRSEAQRASAERASPKAPRRPAQPSSRTGADVSLGTSVRGPGTCSTL